MIRNFTFLILCTLALSTTVKAQDPHFSQFFASPLTLNPAFTGKFDGIFRVAANHRDQWPSIPKAYVTTSASLDFGILRNRLPEGDVFGLGLSGLSDQSADNALKLNYGSLALSYHKALDADGFNTVGVGFQATYSSMNLDITKLKFEDQLTANGFTGSTNEILTNGSTQNYLDVNAGLLYSGSSDGNNNYYFGASVYHINRPAVGFIDQLWLLNPRFTLHGGYSAPIGGTFSMHTSAIFQYQNNASEIVGGAAISSQLNDPESLEPPKNVYLGAWLRLNDAVIPYAGLEFNNLRLGFSYDVNISSLKSATASKGGTEISLIYIHQKEDRGKGLPCPRF